jgi:metallo-beta-lactamase class B
MSRTKFALALSACVATCLLPRMAVAQPGVCDLAPGQTAETLSQSYRCSKRADEQFQKVPPIKLFDNLYYVGPGYVSVWLIPTADGLILIDAAEERYVDHILDSIRRVGFDPRNIRYIFITHGHLDHFGGVARIQELSGARVGAVEQDWRLIEAAGSQPGRGGDPPPRVPRRDLVITDGQTITLGGETLKLYHTPGHTPGVLSAEFTVREGARSHKAFLWGGPGDRPEPGSAESALASANRVAQIPGVEVGIMVHSWLASNYVYPGGGIFERAPRLAQRRPGDPHPFVDAASWNRFVADTRETVTRSLERQRAAPRPAR